MPAPDALSDDVAIILPVYNEEKTVGGVVGRLLEVRGDRPWEILAVDDASTDGTPGILASFGDRIRVVRHPVNYGYGAALKSGIRTTRATDVVFLDADGQHDPALVPYLVEGLREHEFVIGVRTTQASVPWVRRPGKLVLKLVVRFLIGRRIDDVNCGLRAGHRTLYLRMLDIMPDGFSFSTTSLVYVLKSRFRARLLEVPIQTRKGISTVRIVRDGLNTLLLSLRLIMLFDPIRAFAAPSLLLILAGVAYQVYIFAWKGWHIEGGAIISILAGIVIFHFALLADQIASIRKEMSANSGLLEEIVEKKQSRT